MIIITIRNFKNGIFRVCAVIAVVVFLYFALPTMYNSISETQTKEDDYTELTEPLRVEKEMEPEHLSAWFNSLIEE